MSVYWRDPEHKQNFQELNRIFKSDKEPERQTVLYLASLPLFYNKIKNHITWDKPVAWAFKYLDWSNEYQEGWSEEEHDKWIEKKPFDLTGSMKGLMLLMLHLWNERNAVNLLDIISRLDEYNQKVVLSMIEIRMGYYRESLLLENSKPICENCSSDIDVLSFKNQDKKYKLCSDCRTEFFYSIRNPRPIN